MGTNRNSIPIGLRSEFWCHYLFRKSLDPFEEKRQRKKADEQGPTLGIRPRRMVQDTTADLSKSYLLDPQEMQISYSK